MKLWPSLFPCLSPSPKVELQMEILVPVEGPGEDPVWGLDSGQASLRLP